MIVDVVRVVVGLAFYGLGHGVIGAEKLIQLNVKGSLADLACMQTMLRMSKLLL